MASNISIYEVVIPVKTEKITNSFSKKSIQLSGFKFKDGFNYYPELQKLIKPLSLSNHDLPSAVVGGLVGATEIQARCDKTLVLEHCVKFLFPGNLVGGNFTNLTVRVWYDERFFQDFRLEEEVENAGTYSAFENLGPALNFGNFSEISENLQKSPNFGA